MTVEDRQDGVGGELPATCGEGVGVEIGDDLLDDHVAALVAFGVNQLETVSMKTAWQRQARKSMSLPAASLFLRQTRSRADLLGLLLRGDRSAGDLGALGG